jgi:hypothetical protein
MKWFSSVSKNTAVSVIKIYHCLPRDDADNKKTALSANKLNSCGG